MNRGSAHNGGPGIPDVERNNPDQMLAVYYSQRTLFEFGEQSIWQLA
jgi:hypothetical protein